MSNYSTKRSVPLFSAFGIGITAIGLFIGCLVARVSTFTCIRDELGEQQGHCQLEQSTLFMPWVKKVSSIPLSDIQKAESVELNVESHSVVLRLRNDAPKFSLHKSEYSQNTEQLAAQINSFLSNSKVKSFSLREGGGIEETLILLGFCGFGLLFAWLGGRKF
jgi:hypothetical protein